MSVGSKESSIGSVFTFLGPGYGTSSAKGPKGAAFLTDSSGLWRRVVW